MRPFNVIKAVAVKSGTDQDGRPVVAIEGDHGEWIGILATRDALAALRKAADECEKLLR